MAEEVGQAECPECSAVAKVCQDKRKQLYLNCVCGIFKYQSKIGQERLKKRMEAFSSKSAPVADLPKEESDTIPFDVEQEKPKKELPEIPKKRPEKAPEKPARKSLFKRRAAR